MKHFHGTPISGTNVAQIQVLRGRYAFIPWKKPLALMMAMEVCRGFAVDNSAFSFWTSKETPNWTDYLKWVKQFARHPRFEFAVIPDVIDGGEQENDDLLKWWNKHAWHPVRIHSCPVWHLHESLDRLERLATGSYDIIAIGSSGEYAHPGSDSWWARMEEAWPVIADDVGYPRVRVHGLRMLREDIVRAFPFYSADSTNAAQNGIRTAHRYGMKCSAWGSQVKADQIESVQSPAVWTPQFDNQFELEW